MPAFEVVSSYTPSGDQPQAIEKLARGIEDGLREQVLLGVTGSGKTTEDTTITSRRSSREAVALRRSRSISSFTEASFSIKVSVWAI